MKRKVLLLLTLMCLYSMGLCAATIVQEEPVKQNFKFIFAGTPFVKYAHDDGTIWLTQNFYHHDYYVQDNFAHSVSQWTGDNGKTYLVDNLPLDPKVVTCDTLTADVVLTPTYVFNEEDLGDATVTVTWLFEQPDTSAPCSVTSEAKVLSVVM